MQTQATKLKLKTRQKRRESKTRRRRGEKIASFVLCAILKLAPSNSLSLFSAISLATSLKAHKEPIKFGLTTGHWLASELAGRSLLPSFVYWRRNKHSLSAYGQFPSSPRFANIQFVVKLTRHCCCCCCCWEANEGKGKIRKSISTWNIGAHLGFSGLRRCCRRLGLVWSGRFQASRFCLAARRCWWAKSTLEASIVCWLD